MGKARAGRPFLHRTASRSATRLRPRRPTRRRHEEPGGPGCIAEVRMKATAWLLTTVFLLPGSASGSLYYHERSDGTRYYQTRTGQLVAVAKNGEVLEAPVMYGAGYKKQLQKKGDDWDVTGYDIVEPPGYCQELLSRRAGSCLHRIWGPGGRVPVAPVFALAGRPLAWVRPPVP